MKKHIFIKEKLFGKYENFSRYCKESGKKFVDELKREDFIAYRVEYAVPRAKVVQLQDLLGFCERGEVEKVPLQQDISDGLNAFVFIAGTVSAVEDEMLADLPDLMHEELFAATVKNLAYRKNCPEEIIRAKLTKIYRHSGQFFHRGRLTAHFKCAHVLKERFPHGYKVNDKSFYSRFIRYMQELFNAGEPFEQRALDALVKKVGVLCDRNKYIHPDRVRVPAELLKRVENFIEASDCNLLFYKTIFEALKDSFVGTQITNPYFLEGIMKLRGLPYTFGNRYLTKTPGIDLKKEFNDFVAERGEVSMQEIKEDFASFSVAATSKGFLLSCCPAVLSAGYGKFMHAKHLNLLEEDFKLIKKFLYRHCSTPVHSRVLFDRFFEYFADFLRRNDVQSHDKLFSILKYMFKADFNFSRPYISPKDMKIVGNKGFLLDLLEGMEEIAIEDLVHLCAENGLRFSSISHLIESLSPEFVRIDAWILRRPETIGITKELVAVVADRLRTTIKRNGGWQAVEVFDDYEWLPRSKKSWNSFLLEGVASLSVDAPYRLKNPSRAEAWSGTVFVSDRFVGDSFKTFLQKVLIAEHEREPFQSESEIFKWLRMHGLCNKALPKFLTNGKAFDFLNEGSDGDLSVCLRMGQRYGRI